MHPRSTAWFPPSKVDYVKTYLRQDFHKEVRACLRSEFPRPDLPDKIVDTPEVDPTMVTYLKKYTKDPEKDIGYRRDEDGEVAQSPFYSVYDGSTGARVSRGKRLALVNRKAFEVHQWGRPRPSAATDVELTQWGTSRRLPRGRSPRGGRRRGGGGFPVMSRALELGSLAARVKPG
ncbi:hypothetical protein NDU88_006768 [Pleurodeles waltl]|uniref:Uncharacterized protein n=1 Tax=Pleurodeles waltl TaxID=8319 RepID=A0AAV7WDI2_PLEWA|nr:hypothetical protein NDU88_006768 [Pleurodeles waltl]